MNALRSERGSIVLGGLIKLLMIAVVAALAVVAYDCAAIGYTRYGAADHGAVAADAAGERWRATHDITQAYDVAQQKLTPTGETINPKTFSIGADDTVSFDVRSTASTLLAQHLSSTRHYTVLVVHIETTSIAP